ncbi:Nuclear transcription factor Y subunit B-6 [Linum grandiflorum]
MPIANVIRIMRRILPPHAKISDDAKETIQECVSEYISFVTGEANERCQREQRKTVTADDVLWAMGKLGFDNYVEPLSLYLARYTMPESGVDQHRAVLHIAECFMRVYIKNYPKLKILPRISNHSGSAIGRYRETEGDRAAYRDPSLLLKRTTPHGHHHQDFGTMMMQQPAVPLPSMSYNMQQQQQQQQGPNNFQMHNNNIEHQGMYDASSSGGYYRDPSFGSGSGQGSGSGGEDGWGSHFDIYPQFK